MRMVKFMRIHIPEHHIHENVNTWRMLDYANQMSRKFCL
jgi:hypothetical protein